jgi:8-oxo-dGTP pyrophosphatase MutT (NUDIX family)
VIREFTVAVFVVHDGQVLLHWHRKLRRWLPPGGHIEAGELPDEAAIRETLEETGMHVTLVDAPLAPGVEAPITEPGSPPRLAQPLGVQLEDIAPGHQHIDLIYLARPQPGRATRPVPAADDPEARPAWFGPETWGALRLTEEVRRWARAAVDLLPPLLDA